MSFTGTIKFSLLLLKNSNLLGLVMSECIELDSSADCRNKGSCRHKRSCQCYYYGRKQMFTCRETLFLTALSMCQLSWNTSPLHTIPNNSTPRALLPYMHSSFFLSAKGFRPYLHFSLAAGLGISLKNCASPLLALVPFSPQLEMPCDNRPERPRFTFDICRKLQSR